METIAELVRVDENTPDIGHALHLKLQIAKKQWGMWFFVIGGILRQIKEGEFWKGKSESFEAYCADEGLGKYDAIQEKIRCYHNYVERLQLPESILEELAQRDKTALDKAGPYITVENQEEWIKKLNTLSRDAIIQEIREENGKSPVSQTIVDKLVGLYRMANQDERAEFHRRIGKEA